MMRNLSGHKWITFCVLFAVLNAYMLPALASPAAAVAPRGDLSARGRVLLNGQEAISGTTVFSASSVTTEHDSTAIIRLTDLGHVTLLADTDFRLDYDASRLAGALGAGGAEVSSVKGTLADFTAGDLHVTSDPSEAATFSLKTADGVTTVTALKGRLVVESGGRRVPVEAGEFFSSGMASPGQQPPAKNDDDDDKRKVAFLLLGIGGVIAAIAYVVTRNDSSSGLGGDNGGGINPSPAR
jgi:ferric-dicitrate binding protein FerR (iron transport regulator)